MGSSMYLKGSLGMSMNIKCITPKMRAMADNGEYTISREEAEAIHKRNKANKQKQAFRKTVHDTTCEKLSKLIHSPITMELIESCTDFTVLRNGFSIKCIEKATAPVILLRTRKGAQYTFRVVK